MFLRDPSKTIKKEIANAVADKAKVLIVGSANTVSVRWSKREGGVVVHWCFGERMIESKIVGVGDWWETPNAVNDAVEAVAADYEHVSRAVEAKREVGEMTDFGEDRSA